MAEFPSNLDDGELWLPSNVFLAEVPSRYNPYRLSCKEDLAGHFASLSLLQNNPSSTLLRSPPKTALNSQRVKMAVREISADRLPPGYVGFNGGDDDGAELGRRLYGCGTGSLLTRSEPFYEFQVQQQVDSYMETRSKVLQSQINPFQNRVYPFRGSGLGFCGSGGGGGGASLVRETGGTGVFHPRIANPTTAFPATADFKKKQGVRNRQEIQVTSNQQRNSIRRAGLNKQEDCYYHLPPETGLPQDWTY